MSDKTLTIGQVAKATRLSPKAIRLYEAKGLLQSSKRTGSGYRLFGEQDVKVLDFIRQAKTLGLQLQEINSILELQRGGTQPCQRVLGMLESRVEEIDHTINDLKRLRGSLYKVCQAARNNQNQGESAVVCSLIESAMVIG